MCTMIAKLQAIIRRMRNETSISWGPHVNRCLCRQGWGRNNTTRAYDVILLPTWKLPSEMELYCNECVGLHPQQWIAYRSVNECYNHCWFNLFMVCVTTFEMCIVEGEIVQWQINWIGWGRKPFWGDLRYYSSISLQELKKTTKHLW